MRSWMNWSPNTNWPSVLVSALAVLLTGPFPLVAQEPLERRYQRAIELFNSAKMEDACEQLQQIEKEKPGYQQVRTYLNPACKEAERMRSLEQTLFDEGVQLFNQGKYEEAQGKLRQAQGIPLKSPRYRNEIAKYLADIDTRMGEDRLFSEGVKFFTEGNDTEARARFSQVVRGGGPKAAEARGYLQRIEERREESAFTEGVRLFNSGDYAAARTRLQEVVGLNGKRRADAQRYLGQIDQAEREQRAFNDAVRAFEQKRYSEAQTGFRQVAGMGGNRKAEAERYLARLDTALKEEAVFQEAVRKFDQKDFEGARAAFQQVINLKGERAADARVYLTRIEARGEDPRQVARRLVTEAQTALGRKDYRAAVEKLQTATTLDPGNREVARLLAQAQELGSEEPLRSGLRAYFEAKYDEAERQLTDYLNNSGRKRALATFFRGATHCARYFLSGEKDIRQKELALENFRGVQKEAARFRPPEKFVSPKVLALYTEATGAETR